MTGKEKIVLIGAGSLQFGLESAGAVLTSKTLDGCTLCLHDISAKSLNFVTQACKDAIETRNLNYTLESTTSRPEALKDATFIINSIEVAPRFKYWDQDQVISQKYFPKQLFGENGGPGGFFHALRVVPPILDICEDIMKICPEAYFINFSNPMSRICLAIYRKYPKLKFVGLCHEIAFAERILPKMMNTPLSNIKMIAGGLNHFGVVLEAKYKDTGKDGYPEIKKNWPKYYKKWRFIINLDLIDYIFKNYGYLPYTQDSHYGEYIHWAKDTAYLRGIRWFRNGYEFFLGRRNKKIVNLIKKGKGEKLVKEGHEQAIPIVEAILTDAKSEQLSVNLPNDDIITNLPRDLVVECPAIVDKEGIHGVKLGEYPKGLAALLRNQASVQDLVVESILSKSKNVALQALLADPIVDNASKAEELLNEMLEVQKEVIYLE
ncbi:MAG: hypothetical protein GY870_16835 [archaeon]|nr:hypothetical protein [archaeon]